MNASAAELHPQVRRILSSDQDQVELATERLELLRLVRDRRAHLAQLYGTDATREAVAYAELSLSQAQGTLEDFERKHFSKGDDHA